MKNNYYFYYISVTYPALSLKKMYVLEKRICYFHSMKIPLNLAA